MSEERIHEGCMAKEEPSRRTQHVGNMIKIVKGLLNKQTEELHLLELGCGTGDYSVEFVQNGIRNLTMLDASLENVQQAKLNVVSYGEAVKDVRHYELPTLPYNDESFDVISMVHMLHHLTSSPTPEESDELGDEDTFSFNQHYLTHHTKLVDTIKECFRVLKHGGVLFIDTCFESNVDTHWLSLAPRAMELFKDTFVPGHELIKLLKAERYNNIFFTQTPSYSPSETCLSDNTELIFDEAWRSRDVRWSFAEKTGESRDVIEMMRKLKRANRLKDFAYEMDKAFRLVGESTTVYAQKP